MAPTDELTEVQLKHHLLHPLSLGSNHEQAHRELITANHILHNHGLVDAYGHISIRHPTNPSQYIMCGYMAPALVSHPADLITYDIATSNPITSVPHPGYSERFIHSELFKRYPSINCVIHSHAEDVLPYVVSGVPLKPVYHMAGFLGGSVPVWDIGPEYDSERTPDSKRDMLVNNIALGKSLAERFGGVEGGDPEHAAVLMRRHGFSVVADGIEKAVYRAIYTKINAKALTDALAVRRHYGTEMPLAFEAGDMGLPGDQVVGSTEMNERFQWVFLVSSPVLSKCECLLTILSVGTSRGSCG
jgi:ribulose-5-phosphate 4-epimerase/fuculose-1-phosphate aldolase